MNYLLIRKISTRISSNICFKKWYYKWYYLSQNKNKTEINFPTDSKKALTNYAIKKKQYFLYLANIVFLFYFNRIYTCVFVCIKLYFKYLKFFSDKVN